MSGEVHWGYLLESESGLDGYIFTDWSHVERFMGQGWVAKSPERVAVVACTYRKRACCGQSFAIKRGRVMLSNRRHAA